ncbi:zinc-binding dehydrogenase [Bacillus sp. 1P06AnD]|uniref:zinc-binding dehydrogenase n=1 Tax=Bacillus sp. 1P06AnD TaxID=3132208 RepID=UPI0039A066B5
MKAIIHKGKLGKDGLSLSDIELQEPGHGEVRVKMKAAGLNHRDLFVLQRHKEEEPALVIGSDGAGIIEKVGEGVDEGLIGKEVMILPSLGWKYKSDAPPESFEIVGLPDHGTFSEYIVIPQENAVEKPNYLNWEEAGVLSLSALTAYRALFTKGRVKPGMKILIPGIGSGVATFLLQFAVAAGAEVTVTSRSEKKRDLALKLGASSAIDSDSEWEKSLNGNQVDLVIESVGAATFHKSLRSLKKGGTVVTFGASAGDVIELNLRDFFYGQLTMHGTSMGSGEEYRELLAFAEKHSIKPVIDQIWKLEDYDKAIKHMEDAGQFGKIGLSIS